MSTDTREKLTFDLADGQQLVIMVVDGKPQLEQKPSARTADVEEPIAVTPAKETTQPAAKGSGKSSDEPYKGPTFAYRNKWIGECEYHRGGKEWVRVAIIEKQHGKGFRLGWIRKVDTFDSAKSAIKSNFWANRSHKRIRNVKFY